MAFVVQLLDVHVNVPGLEKTIQIIHGAAQIAKVDDERPRHLRIANEIGQLYGQQGIRRLIVGLVGGEFVEKSILK
jgi:hypothetical protein